MKIYCHGTGAENLQHRNGFFVFLHIVDYGFNYGRKRIHQNTQLTASS